MGTAIKHPVLDRVKQSFVTFDIRALWHSALSVIVPGCQKLQMTGLTRSGTECCTYMATVGVKGLKRQAMNIRCYDDRDKLIRTT